MREHEMKDMSRILVVEDSPTQAEWLKLILGEAGFVADIAVDGTTALARLAGSPFDMVISDIVMPGLSGYELCRKIKADPVLRHIPVVLLTAREDPTDIFRGLDCGADNFYTKPYDPDRLVGRIRNILSNRALRLLAKREDGVEVSFSGQTFIVASGKEQILDLLVSTFEDIVLANLDLEKSRNELVAAKAAVEEYARLLESRARSSEEVHRTIIEGVTEGIITMDERGIVNSINPAAEEIFGYAAHEVIGQNVSLLIPEPHRGAPDAAIASYVQARFGKIIGKEPSEVEGLRKDGKVFPLLLGMSEMIAEDRRLFIGLTQDISARRASEVQIRQLQKMEAVGQLTGGIAHDFNNILMVIVSNTEELQEEEDLDPRLRERLKDIGQAAERATDLTRSLLAFSRKLPLRPQRTDINELVVRTGKLMRSTLGAQIEIDSVLAEGLWTVNVDRPQFENALVNLCVNARDAMPAGGRLLIETANVTLDDAYVAQNPDAAAGAYVMISVTDTGVGIPRDQLAKVFEPFFTTKEVGKGTGLGLSMVHGFVKQSDGHIGISSEPGVGTVISMYLPRSDGVHAQNAPASVQTIPRGSERILVVEDEAKIRDVVVQQLQSLGYAVDQASDGTAGLAAVAAAARPYDLVLTDITMPGQLNGRALADAVQSRRPETGVLFMSGYPETSVIRGGHLAASIQFLVKPFRKVDLALAVRRVLDKSSVAAG
jgi:PAS domain S-box-containing protein